MNRPSRLLARPQVLGWGSLRLVALAPLLGLAHCSQSDSAPDPDKAVVEQCYRPFFRAADAHDADAMQRVVTKETKRRYEAEEFVSRRLFSSWTDVTHAYANAQTSVVVQRVAIDGSRAVVTDAVGGRIFCQLEDGVWRVDLLGPR